MNLVLPLLRLFGTVHVNVPNESTFEYVVVNHKLDTCFTKAGFSLKRDKIITVLFGFLQFFLC